ncbi:MAG: SDR family oxidoreductase [Candidatus Lernaella stagnicola]|nr:SDR family oxidoreductase [Candidatus Lernaella stagnicola]
MARMKGKVVLITGGARGIGLATAENFAKAGSTLVLTDLNDESLQAAKHQLAKYKVPVETFVCNVSNRAEVEKTIQAVIAGHGGIDVLINNAGVGHMGELAETSFDAWHLLMDVNFWGPLHHIYAVLPNMIERGGGRIVNVSSGQAFLQLPTWGAYSAIKAALGVFSEVLHWEVRKHDIVVTTVYPYMVNTGLYDEIEGDTFFGKMAMKLLPLYSQSAETVGRIVFQAVRRGKRVENVSFFNSLFKTARFFSPIGNTISWVSNAFLSKDADEADVNGSSTG